MNRYKVSVKDLEGKETNSSYFETQEQANEWVSFWMKKEKPWYKFKGGEFPKNSALYPVELVVREFEKTIDGMLEDTSKTETWVEVKNSFTVEVIDNKIEFEKYKNKKALKEKTMEELKIKASERPLKNDELTYLVKTILNWE